MSLTDSEVHQLVASKEFGSAPASVYVSCGQDVIDAPSIFITLRDCFLTQGVILPQLRKEDRGEVGRHVVIPPAEEACVINFPYKTQSVMVVVPVVGLKGISAVSTSSFPWFRVREGDVVGWRGNSCSSEGGPPHFPHPFFQVKRCRMQGTNLGVTRVLAPPDFSTSPSQRMEV